MWRRRSEHRPSSRILSGVSVFVLMTGIALVGACGAVEEPSLEPPPERDEPPPAETRLGEAPELEADEVVTAAVYAPDPDGYGDACSDQEPCAWDDPCQPTRCVATSNARMDTACTETQPVPGICGCMAGRCTTRPQGTPEPPPEACGGGISCGLDQGAGHCVVGSGRRANQGTLLVEGPMCLCDHASGQCLFEWVDPVPCRRDFDCWFDYTPRLHPIRRPRRVRKRFRPCEDGENEPICRNGSCTFGMSFPC